MNYYSREFKDDALVGLLVCVLTRRRQSTWSCAKVILVERSHQAHTTPSIGMRNYWNLCYINKFNLMYLHRTNTLHSLHSSPHHPPYQHNMFLCNGGRVTSTRLHTSHTHNHLINTYTRHTAHPYRVPRIRSCSTPPLLHLHAPVSTLVGHVGRISRSSTVTSRVLRWHSHSRSCGQHQLRLGHDHRRLLF